MSRCIVNPKQDFKALKQTLAEIRFYPVANSINLKAYIYVLAVMSTRRLTLPEVMQKEWQWGILKILHRSTLRNV